MPSQTRSFIQSGITHIPSSRAVIAVTMATSRQGLEVVKGLSSTNSFQVRAITRDPSSERAIALAKMPNVEVVQGDLLNKESLLRCFSGAYGIFGNTTPTRGWRFLRGSMDPSYELEQGRNLINAVIDVRYSGSLKHFVFSSICKPLDPLKNEKAPGHFTSKWKIEDYITLNSLKQCTTILRPVSYFENFDTEFPGLKVSNRIFPGVVNPNKVWQTIAVEDIGAWAVAVFKNPQKFLGESLNIAGESMTGKQMANVLEGLLPNQSIKVQYIMIPRILINLLEHDIGIMANWIEKNGYGADLPKLRSLANEIGLNMTSMSTWLKKKNLTFSQKRNGNNVLENPQKLSSAT